MVTEKNLKNVIDFFIRGKKQNILIIFISQTYFQIPKPIGLQCNYFILMKDKF